MKLNDRFIKDDVDRPVIIPGPNTEGTSSKILYFDKDGKACDQKDAAKSIITTYDKDGNRISETWGEMFKEEKKDSDSENHIKAK